jgi:hypothetical protein
MDRLQGADEMEHQDAYGLKQPAQQSEASDCCACCFIPQLPLGAVVANTGIHAQAGLDWCRAAAART